MKLILLPLPKYLHNMLVFNMVPEGGLEPPRLSAPDPKSGVSANSTTRALASFHAVSFSVQTLLSI